MSDREVNAAVDELSDHLRAINPDCCNSSFPIRAATRCMETIKRHIATQPSPAAREVDDWNKRLEGFTDDDWRYVFAARPDLESKLRMILTATKPDAPAASEGVEILGDANTVQITEGDWTGTYADWLKRHNITVYPDGRKMVAPDAELPGYVRNALAAIEPHHADTLRDYIAGLARPGAVDDEAVRGLRKLALMWERHAREYFDDSEDVGNGLSSELRKEHRVREAMCRHHASQLHRAIAALQAAQLTAGAGGVKQVWRETYSTIVRNLAEIVTAPQTDEQCGQELLPRSYVMDRVVRIRQACDATSAALRAATTDAQRGEDGNG